MPGRPGLIVLDLQSGTVRRGAGRPSDRARREGRPRAMTVVQGPRLHWVDAPVLRLQG